MTTMLIIGIAILQTIISIINTYNQTYYTALATQAGEAGIALANTCATKNGYERSWGDVGTTTELTQRKDCNGNAISGIRPYIVNENAKYRTSFVVGDLTARIDGSLIIKSVGTIEFLNASNSKIVGKDINVVVNQLLTWPVSYTGSTTSSGWARTCGIISRAAYCWGTNEIGQLGDGQASGTNSTVPVKVQQDIGLLKGKTVTTIRSGHSHNCVLAGGEVFCWGSNEYGQIGNSGPTGSGKFESVPVKVPGLSGVTDISAAAHSTCALMGGEVYCWGKNAFGELGTGNTTQRTSPTKVVNLTGITKLMSSGAGMETMCAIGGVGTGTNAYCWGKNSYGQLGNNTKDANSDDVSPIANPTPVTVLKETGVLAGKTITDISGDAAWNGGETRYGHVCAIADSKAYCWGYNDNGEVGDGTGNQYRPKPTAVVTTTMSGAVTELVVGSMHSCAIANSKVYCWGDNYYGQVGDNTWNNSMDGRDRFAPVLVVPDATGIFQVQPVTQLGGGFNRGCGVAAQKTFCWGNNAAGQIGDGSYGNVKDIPVEATFLRPKAPIFLF